MSSDDLSERLAESLVDAYQQSSPVYLTGNGSKLSEGFPVKAQPLSVSGHRGILDYTPSELVIKARAGTPLAEIEARLASARQMLPFEPPGLGDEATIGGTIACGLSGPRRPYAGAARDMVLGMRIVNGRGEILNFGGQVMKNVAGYDVSRLMAGAQGTLGLILDISLKVSPMPECEQTLCLQLTEKQAIEVMNVLGRKAIPLSASCYVPDAEENNQSGQLWLRLSGVETAVKEAKKSLGGELIEKGKQFWLDLKERRLGYFTHAGTGQSAALWRLSVPPATPPLSLSNACLLDWGGAQRWLMTRESPDIVYNAVNSCGGHATLYSSNGAQLPPLVPGLAKLHQRLKNAFDPKGILNPGRLYEGL